MNYRFAPTDHEIAMRADIGPAIATCSWLWRVAPGRPYEKLIADEKPSECRASIGERIVTVWLPKGAVVRFRRSRWDEKENVFERTFAHRYGRDNENKIEIRLRRATLEEAVAAGAKSAEEAADPPRAPYAGRRTYAEAVARVPKEAP